MLRTPKSMPGKLDIGVLVNTKEPQNRSPDALSPMYCSQKRAFFLGNLHMVWVKYLFCEASNKTGRPATRKIAEARRVQVLDRGSTQPQPKVQLPIWAVVKLLVPF